MTPAYLALLALGISVTLVLAITAFAYRYGKWQGEVNSDRIQFGKFIEEIRRDIKDILSRLQPSPTASASPIQLTVIGERISENINARSWAEKIANEMVDETKELDSLEIQNMSFEKAQEFTPDEDMHKKMRDSAFQEGIDLDGIRKVLGVELRDRLLALHGKGKDSLDQ